MLPLDLLSLYNLVSPHYHGSFVLALRYFHEKQTETSGYWPLLASLQAARKDVLGRPRGMGCRGRREGDWDGEHM